MERRSYSPHCGSVDSASRLQGVKDKKGRVRNGLWKCYAKECRKQFTVSVGTVFESAHIPLQKMLQAAYLMSCQKGRERAPATPHSGDHLQVGLVPRHRIREAMRDGSLAPMGGGGRHRRGGRNLHRQFGRPAQAQRGFAHKNVVLTLVERGGCARRFHIDSTTLAHIVPIVRQNVRRESDLMTDEARHYVVSARVHQSHDAVEHSAR